MYRIGIDVGSTYTKYCVQESDGRTVELFWEQTPVRQKEYFREKLAQLRERYPGCRIVSCGYGRRNVEFDRTVSELTALAAGAAAVCPSVPVILDIGGQDTKVVRQERGRLKAFFVNEKCAAGCGLFLRNVLDLLYVSFRDLDLTGGEVPELRLSSVCAVFAQSEIVELIAEGVPEERIIRAVIVQILTQAKVLLGKVDCEQVVLSGGLTHIPGIQSYAERVWGKKVTVPKSGAFLSSIGCTMLEG